jgi:PTS system nitrogen regulatory IIA component
MLLVYHILRKKMEKSVFFLLDFYNNSNYTIHMNLRTVLTTDTVNLHLKGTNKEEIIDEMLEILIAAGKVTDKDAARECVLDRERKMSTGMKHGIAIPHGKTDTVDDLVACIGISDSPVDFDSLDQEPCRIFIMTLSPVNKTGPHLQFLAEVSLLFKSAEKRQEILKTTDKAEVIKILTE